MMKISKALGVMLLGVSAAAANAAVITFSSLGSSGAFTSTSEAGYNVTAITSNWQASFAFGNPVPSIFNDSASIGTIEVTAVGGGLFEFDGVDFGCGVGASSSCTGSVSGFVGGASGTMAFSTATGLLANNGTFSSFLPGLSSFAIDTLRISIDRADSNIDNIRLSTATVPEPGTLALAGFALAGLATSLRRKV